MLWKTVGGLPNAAGAASAITALPDIKRYIRARTV